MRTSSQANEPVLFYWERNTMTPHQANLFFIAEYVLTILILAFSAYRKTAYDWR